MYAQGYKTTTIANRLLAADATKALIAAPGAGYKLVIMKINFEIITAAAQAIDVGVSGGGVTKQALSIAASATGTGGANHGENGFELDENVALTALPGGAGPAVQFQVEYFVKRVALGS